MKVKKEFTFLVSITVVLFLFFSFITVAYAQSPIRKLGRGVANIATGIFEVPINIVSVGEEDGFLAATTYGVIKGLAMAILRTGVGVYETVTFPIPLPFNYEPVLEPEFLMSEDNF